MIDLTMFLFETDSTVLLEHAIQSLMVTQHQIVILLSWHSLVYVLYINISIIYIHASYIYIYTNMNMNVIYYFKVYVELRFVIAKLLSCVKRLYSAAP